MNDFDFDLELKARVSREASPVPAGYEGQLLADLDRTLQMERTRPRTRRQILRPVLAAAVLTTVLLVPVCASVWRGWLEPVVDRKSVV